MNPSSKHTVAALHARGSALASAATDKLLPLPAVIAVTGASKTTIYRWVDTGIFPKARRIGPRRIAWLASEVNAWLSSRAVAA